MRRHDDEPHGPPASARYDRDDRDAYPEPARRTAGVFVLAHAAVGLAEMLLVHAAQSTRFGGSPLHPREVAAVAADFLIGMLLWWRLEAVGLWAILRAIAGIVIVLVVSEGAVTIDLAAAVAFAASVILALVGSPGRARIALAWLAFAAYAIAMGVLALAWRAAVP